jgi:hypothetical protein
VVKSLPSSLFSIIAVLLLAGALRADEPLAAHPITSTLIGKVTDTAGRPIAGANISAYTMPGKTFSTDAVGRFRIDNMPVTWFGSPISVSAKGFSPRVLQPEYGTVKDPAQIAIKLQPGHTVHGRVVDDRGNPVAGANLMVHSGAYLNVHESKENWRTDTDGKFALDSLPGNAQISLTMPSGLYFANMHLKLDRPEEIVYKLGQPGFVRAHVVNAETGKPLEHFRVRLFYWEDYDGAALPPPTMFYNGHWSDPGVTIDSKDGRVTIGPLRYHRPQDLIIEAGGYERSVVPAVVPLHADQANEVQIVMLPIHSSDYSKLYGRIVDDKGRGIAGVHLTLIVARKPVSDDFNWRALDCFQLEPFIERYEPSATDQNGRFEFSKILPGKFLAVAHWGTGAPKSCWFSNQQTVAGKDTTITIDVPKPASIHGSIDRTKLADATAIIVSRLNDPQSFEREVSLGAKQSQFDIVDLGPGNYWVQLFGKPKSLSTINKLQDEELNLVPGETKQVKFTSAQKKH